MNKKLLAVALASAFAAPAMANVTIYGAFDVGVAVRGSATDANKGAPANQSGSVSTVASGMNGHNGIGFKMSEDLGNGMTLSGDAMFGFALDSSGVSPSGSANGGLSTIYSYLALSGDFGTVIGGRAGGARAGFIKKYDPFGGFGVGGALAAQGGGADYADNVLAWITPEVLPGLKMLFAYTSNLLGQDRSSNQCGAAGFTQGATESNEDFAARVALATATSGGSAAKNCGGSPLYAIAGLYNAGPVDLTIAYENLTLDGTGTSHRNVWTGGGSYDFGVAKVMANYNHIEGIVNGWQAGVLAPVSSQATLKLSYNTSTLHAGSKDKCSKVAAGVNYDLSKRTRVYADVAHLIDDDRNGACASGLTTGSGGAYASAGAGRDDGVGFGRSGANVGIRHSF
jgi:predicted porin